MLWVMCGLFVGTLDDLHRRSRRCGRSDRQTHIYTEIDHTPHLHALNVSAYKNHARASYTAKADIMAELI